MAEKSEKFLCELYIQTDSKERRTAIETLLTLFRNLLKDDDKFKKINLSNSSFLDKVWKYFPAQKFLIYNGWKVRGNELVFSGSDSISDIINVLLEYRNVVPDDEEWRDDTKLEGQSKEQLREQELRRKAVEQRDKELEEFMKDKKERQELARNIKIEMAADRRKKKVYTKPEVGNVLKKGATVRTLYS